MPYLTPAPMMMTTFILIHQHTYYQSPASYASEGGDIKDILGPYAKH